MLLVGHSSVPLPEEVVLTLLSHIGLYGRALASRTCNSLLSAVRKNLTTFDCAVECDAGSAHTAVVFGGALFTFGSGMGGKLGHGTEQNRHCPRMVHALAGKLVVCVAGGDGITVACTDSGEAFGFGNGFDGSLGTGERSTSMVPQPISGLNGHQVKECAAGHMHTSSAYVANRAP